MATQRLVRQLLTSGSEICAAVTRRYQAPTLLDPAAGAAPIGALTFDVALRKGAVRMEREPVSPSLPSHRDVTAHLEKI